jgi:hypothetical protein
MRMGMSLVMVRKGSIKLDQCQPKSTKSNIDKINQSKHRQNRQHETMQR